MAGCLVLSGVLASVAPTGPAAATTSSASASQLLKQSLASATAAGSARISVQFFSGSTTGKVLQDSSLQTGKQTVAIGKEIASVVLVGGTAYISGNSLGMTSFFGMPSTLASAVAGKWISIQSTDSSFQNITANVTLASALTEVTPSGTLAAGKHTNVHGQAVKSIAGQAPGGGGR